LVVRDADLQRTLPSISGVPTAGVTELNSQLLTTPLDRQHRLLAASAAAKLESDNARTQFALPNFRAKSTNDVAPTLLIPKIVNERVFTIRPDPLTTKHEVVQWSLASTVDARTPLQYTWPNTNAPF
jgi:hypothetical protein